MYRKVVKPSLDFLLAMIGLVILLAPMLVVAAAIELDDPGTVFFKQRRVGKKKNGSLTYFNLYKFRSMKMNTPHDMPTHLLKDPEQYVTRVGRFIRKYSIDELPQFLNILQGDMSIIGPRPALWNQDDLIAEREKYGANDVKPGLTGLAQINGRDELSIEQKALYDGKYANSLGFLTDAKCFATTIAKVLKHEGIAE